ncbi:MAG: minor capsid protein [Propionibacteriaceae bacterium]|nr:minor capsid protein [Propionibacteriaceae bacterium]
MTVTKILLALARFLDAEGVGVFKISTPYVATDTAITLKRLPASPDQAISVTLYDHEDAAYGLADAWARVQLRFRAPGPVTAVDDLADAAHAVLNDRHNFDMGGVRVSRARRLNVAPMGQDANRREERADNYELILRLP